MQAGALHRGGGEEQGRLQRVLGGGGEEVQAKANLGGCWGSAPGVGGGDVQAGALHRDGGEEQGFKEEEERKFYHVF